MRIKHSSLLVVLLITVGVFCPLILKNNSVEGAIPPILVGVYENEPKIFTDNTGNWVGFWPEIIEYVADQEGWSIQYVEGTWGECLTRLENNEIDLMVDVGYSEERAQSYDFNNISAFTNWGVIFAHNPGDILSFNDLENKTIAVMNNSIHTTGKYGIINMTDYFEINCTFLVVADYYEVFKLIDNGTVYGGVVNRLFGMVNDDDYNVFQTTLFFNPVDLKFAFPKNATLNDYLIERIDYHLIQLQEDHDSIYYSAIEEFFFQIPVEEKIPDWVIFMIIFIISLVIVFVSMSVYLKYVVNKKTEELRDNNAQLELLNKILIQTNPNGIIYVKRDGNIRIINDNFKELYVKNYEQQIEQGMNIFDLPDNVLSTSLKEKIITTKDLHVKEKGIEKRNIELESLVYLELYSSKLYLKQLADDFGYLFVTNDVTPFIELENLRERFISMISHELRQPITAIVLSLENLMTYEEKLDEEQKMKILEVIKRNSDLLRELVEDLATIINRETETLKINITEFNLNEAVDNLQNELQTRFADKNLEFSTDIPSDLRISGDRKRISQILRILIDNSIKYSPPNSEITIKAVDEYIPPQANKVKPGVLIRVIDNGTGIPEKDIPKLFERFQRGSNVEGTKGSGLGLNIAKILVELHNGFISVESKIGEGSTFSVFIPNVDI